MLGFSLKSNNGSTYNIKVENNEWIIESNFTDDNSFKKLEFDYKCHCLFFFDVHISDIISELKFIIKFMAKLLPVVDEKFRFLHKQLTICLANYEKNK